MNLKKFLRSFKNIGRVKPKTRTKKKMSCSPLVKGKTVNNETCYTPDIILRIRNEYNKNHDADSIIRTSNPKDIWIQLKDKLKCGKEDCWLDQVTDPILKKQIDDFVFAPDSPPEWENNPNEWLSNHDIFKVLRQYELKYKEFDFIGPAMIDFDSQDTRVSTKMCVDEELCKFDLGKHIANGKEKIAVVFNLDKHTQGGSHWVSLFIDIPAKIIFYFDSAGDDIPEEVNTLCKRIMMQGKQLIIPISFKFYKNKGVVHQHTLSECGMYSLYFIITMLTGETEFMKNMTTKQKLQLFIKHRIPDSYVEKFRKEYFNSE